jgi:phosphoribosylamine--glycine ligase
MGATVLVIGSGGREHALVWKLATSSKVSRIIAAPGNDGFEATFGLLEKSSCEFVRWPVNLSLQGAELAAEFKRLGNHALAAKVDLVVVGPDNPLADGIVDILQSQGLACFGPTAAAAKLESSKAFAKEVMKAAGVPSAKYFVAKDQGEAQKILKSVPWPQGKTTQCAKDDVQGVGGWVVKADGLAFGKGVQVCDNFDDATRAVSELIGVSGSLVIEARLRGEEISWFAICDGERCALLEPARDYKRLRDGGEGPNTGGMGAFSPVPEVPSSWRERVRNEIFLPTLREMKKRGTPFRGLLYAGMMCDFSNDQFWVIEFNARFGDPETQVLLPRMTDDLYSWCEASAKGDLKLAGNGDVQFSSQVAVGVVGAARGYPEKPEKGNDLRFAKGALVTSEDLAGYFYAGVARNGSTLKSNGGRVFLALGVDRDFESARKKAYERIEKLTFEGMQYRKDIAQGIQGGVS